MLTRETQLIAAGERSDVFSLKEILKIGVKIAFDSRRSASFTLSISSRCSTTDLNLERNLDLDLFHRQQCHLLLQSWLQEDLSNAVANMGVSPHSQRFLQMHPQDMVYPLVRELRFLGRVN
jgi:hypothetical protein